MTEERRINEKLNSLLQEFGDLKVKYREEKEKNDAIELVIFFYYKFTLSVRLLLNHVILQEIESKIATKYDLLISELKQQNDQYERELKSIKVSQFIRKKETIFFSFCIFYIKCKLFFFLV